MTYSIVAKDPRTGEYGIAVASRFFAVGALVPHMDGGAGAVATQAFVSPLYGTVGLKLLREGYSARETLEAVTGSDEGRHSRQLHLIDSEGRSAAFTGEACIDWAGHLVAENVSVAGNMLAGPAVIEKTLAAYQANDGLPLVERLLAAMEAGEAAGGDKRGRQSAALRIMRGEVYPWLDIRTDDHADPLPELRRLYAVAQERFLHVAELLPTTGNASGLLDRSEIDRKIEALEADRISRGLPSASLATPPATQPDTRASQSSA